MNSNQKSNKFKQLTKFIFSEKFLFFTSLSLLLEIYIGLHFIKDGKLNTYELIFLLILLVITFLATSIIGIVLFVNGIRETVKKTPFTLICVLLAMVFILAPIYSTGINDTVTPFLVVGIGFGINQVLEGVIKYTESDFYGAQKKYLANLAGFTKIFFNCIYISGYVSTVFNQSLEENKSNYTTNHIINNIILNKGIRFIAIELSIFVLLVLFALFVSSSLRKEINNEPDSDIEDIKRKLNEKQSMLSNFRNNNEQVYQEMYKLIGNLEESIKEDIKRCENFK